MALLKYISSLLLCTVLVKVKTNYAGGGLRHTQHKKLKSSISCVLYSTFNSPSYNFNKQQRFNSAFCHCRMSHPYDDDDAEKSAARYLAYMRNLRILLRSKLRKQLRYSRILKPLVKSLKKIRFSKNGRYLCTICFVKSINLSIGL